MEHFADNFDSLPGILQNSIFYEKALLANNKNMLKFSRTIAIINNLLLKELFKKTRLKPKYPVHFSFMTFPNDILHPLFQIRLNSIRKKRICYHSTIKL